MGLHCATLLSKTLQLCAFLAQAVGCAGKLGGHKAEETPTLGKPSWSHSALTNVGRPSFESLWPLPNYSTPIWKGHKYSSEIYWCTRTPGARRVPTSGYFWHSDITTSLLLPGEMNISQLQCKIDFNTFLFCNLHSWCKKWLRTKLVIGCWVFTVITGDCWC